MENQTDPSFQLPAQLSTIAPEVDSLYSFLFGLSVVVIAVVLGAMIVSLVRYRRRAGVKAEQASNNLPLQVAGIALPLIVILAVFASGWSAYIGAAQAPDDAIAIRVRAEQWSWSFEHPNGFTEENALHVPVDVPVRLVMSSADVLHSFYVPEFRVQREVVPGSFSSVWFQATERSPGEASSATDTVADRELYTVQASCAEHCGSGEGWEPNTGHATMSAVIHVQREQDYRAFVGRGPALPCPQPDGTCGTGGECSAEESGGCLFAARTCAACHQNREGGPQLVGPTLFGAWGHEQPLTDGTSVTVDEAYIRQSILEPGAQIAQGFPPAMPTIPVTEPELAALVAYIQSLQASE